MAEKVAFLYPEVEEVFTAAPPLRRVDAERNGQVVRQGQREHPADPLQELRLVDAGVQHRELVRHAESAAPVRALGHAAQVREGGSDRGLCRCAASDGVQACAVGAGRRQRQCQPVSAQRQPAPEAVMRGRAAGAAAAGEAAGSVHMYCGRSSSAATATLSAHASAARHRIIADYRLGLNTFPPLSPIRYARFTICSCSFLVRGVHEKWKRATAGRA
eukprot:COSAG06_NODE_567_length_14186_cov_3.587918_9_plen_217_part_00